VCRCGIMVAFQVLEWLHPSKLTPHNVSFTHIGHPFVGVLMATAFQYCAHLVQFPCNAVVHCWSGFLCKCTPNKFGVFAVPAPLQQGVDLLGVGRNCSLKH
jgi:hypothetical protein